MSTERVQKILAKAGLASRRKAEELISEGLVTINGKVAKLGDKAEMGKDAIKVNGKLLHRTDPQVYLVFHKPKSVISTLFDPQGRPAISDYIKRLPYRVFPIGRMDFNSEGLILLTNDGEFAEKLQKREDVPRVYEVKIKGHPTLEMLERLKRGIRQGRHLAKPYRVQVNRDLANKTVVEAVFLGSAPVDVKALFESKGFLVEKVTRTGIGHLRIETVPSGQTRPLRKSQVEALLLQPELGMRLLDQSERKDRPVSAVERERDQERAAEAEAKVMVIRKAQAEKREEAHAAKKPRIRPRAQSFDAPRAGVVTSPRVGSGPRASGPRSGPRARKTGRPSPR